MLGPRTRAVSHGIISRYLTNKCAIASRIDSFINTPTTLYGEKMKKQVEERLAFNESGATPSKNLTMMQEVAEELALTAAPVMDAPSTPASKERSIESMDVDTADDSKRSSKKKKSKKSKTEEPVAELDVKEVVAPVEVKSAKKKSKKSKNKEAVVPESPVAAVLVFKSSEKKKKSKSKKSKTVEA